MYVLSASPDTLGQISQQQDFQLPPQGAGDNGSSLLAQMAQAQALRGGGGASASHYGALGGLAGGAAKAGGSIGGSGEHYGLLGGLAGGLDNAAQNHGVLGQLGSTIKNMIPAAGQAAGGAAGAGAAGAGGAGAGAAGAGAAGGGSSLASLLPMLFAAA